ncbi:hypothetical protein LWI29_001766 [Acer saccharum]|uniref:Uncharacterized protein n=1 Tax=Acer saccharum TaxID=4024 RepID=A0AA39RPN0_ACESA|nr:hypothetical protein LWI29_001766 [Acer saccharum]
MWLPLAMLADTIKPPFPPASLSRELPFPIKFQPVKPAAAFQLPSSSSRRVRAVEFQPSSRGAPASSLVRRSSSSLQQRRPASSVQPPSRLVPASPTPSSSFRRPASLPSRLVPASPDLEF